MAILKQDALITEYMCSWCGKTVKQTRGEGRPLPGVLPAQAQRQRWSYETPRMESQSEISVNSFHRRNDLF